MVFDTWTLNCDRHHHNRDVRRPNYDNVYLSSEGVKAGKRQLIAMDHGLCFIRSGEDLSPKLAHIEKVRESRIYGLFPEFRANLREDTIDDCAGRLREMDLETAEAIVDSVPKEWDVSREARAAWSQLIFRRAEVVADHVHEWMNVVMPWFRASGE